MTNYEPKIRRIVFPNTIHINEGTSYATHEGYEFKRIFKNGEMAEIAWIQVLKDKKPVAEIKESVCHIFFEKEQR